MTTIEVHLTMASYHVRQEIIFSYFSTHQNQVYWGEEQVLYNTFLNSVLSSDIIHRYVEDPFRRQLQPTTDLEVFHPTG